MITLDTVTADLQTGKRPKGGAKESGIPSLGAEHLDKSGGFKLTKLKYVESTSTCIRSLLCFVLSSIMRAMTLNKALSVKTLKWILSGKMNTWRQSQDGSDIMQSKRLRGD